MSHLFTQQETTNSGDDKNSNSSLMNKENEEATIVVLPTALIQPKRKKPRLTSTITQQQRFMNKDDHCGGGGSDQDDEKKTRRNDIFERANRHMEQIAVADEEHEQQRKKKLQDQEEYDRVHMKKEKEGSSLVGAGKSRLKGGIISNNFVKTNLKRKTKRFTRRVPRRKNHDTRSSMDDELLTSTEKRKRSDDDESGVSSGEEGTEGVETTTTSRTKKSTRNDNSDDQVHISSACIERIFDSETCESELNRIAKEYFGYDGLRQGQLETTKRILRFKSTLTILPTGTGKSFCYQLAALIMTSKYFKFEGEEESEIKNRLVLVISPLISLMSDQMRQLPDCLPGDFLTASQTKSQRNAVLKRITSGDVRILFISPERLSSDNFLQLLVGSDCRIAFACVDEAHCVSEWSHNFRPSYLHIHSALRNFDVDTILALTATATKATEKDICKRLFEAETRHEEHVIRGTVCRDNLILSSSIVRSSDERFAEVTKLLRSKPFSDSESIIIYTTTKNEADLLCQHLQIHMKDVPGAVKSYHAGMQASTRNSIQKQFISNEVRIIVATVAFGMGINKKDVRSVIHFSLPRSIENYVQEVGRAGRDGIDSPCHLLLCNEDAIRLRSLVFGERASEIDMKRFLRCLFANDAGEFLSGIPELEQELDMSSTVIKTLLTHIELLDTESPMIHVNANCKNRYTVFFHATHPTQLAQTNKLVNSILKVKHKSVKNGQHIFDIASICKETGKTSSEVEKELDALQDCGEIKYTTTEEAFCVEVIRVPNSEEIASLAKILLSKMRYLEQNTLWKLDEMYKLAYRSAFSSLSEFQKRDVELPTDKKQKSIQDQIELYFTSSAELSDNIQSPLIALDLVKTIETLNDNSQSIVMRDASTLLSKHDIKMLSNGKIIARILHGLSSPCFGAGQWVQGGFWGRYRHIDFPTLESLCTRVLISYKQNNS